MNVLPWESGQLVYLVLKILIYSMADITGYLPEPSSWLLNCLTGYLLPFSCLFFGFSP